LKTAVDNEVYNYRDWQIPLGRRFRALKLWFVIRAYGVSGLQEKIRLHLQLTQKLVEKIEKEEKLELLAPVPLNTICFRVNPQKGQSTDELNRLNEKILEEINQSGKAFLTHTKLNGNFTIRVVIGQTDVTEEDILNTWTLICC
jgi:aromatic-L-amino-acid decarboxylase